MWQYRKEMKLLKKLYGKIIAAALAAVTMLSACSVSAFAAQKQQAVGNIAFGDVNKDGEVDIDDVTLLQKYLAKYPEVVELFENDDHIMFAADFNSDDKVDINDVTAIQKSIAGYDYEDPYDPGEVDPETPADIWGHTEPDGTYTIDNIRDYIVGLDTPVELEDGTERPLINFDNAATTPAFTSVMDAVNQELLMYGSIGRGFSQKSNHSTDLYNIVRQKVLDFVGASDSKYTCFYVNNTTDGLNKLASALIENESDIVLTTRMEHHANDLSWRERCRVVYSEVDEKGRVDYDDMERLLKEYRVKYVAVTAASNVTGFVNDVHRIARLAHRYGAKIIVDGAQIVAHREFRMTGGTSYSDIDFFVFSAHKMYSPYGGGAVVGKTDLLEKHMPEFYGGGTVKIVGDYSVTYKDAPASYEAGSPNYPGVIGLGKAIDVLSDVGFEDIQQHEYALNRRLIDGLRELGGDNVVVYGDPDDISDKVGVVTFNFKNANSYLLAQELSKMGGIATRQGAFCAHPYVWRLMHIPDDTLDQFDSCGAMNTPGMIRVSFGIYNTEEEVDEFLRVLPEALAKVTTPDYLKDYGNVRIYY